MAVWNDYNPDDYDENAFDLIPAGKHRVRIENAEDQVSKTGKPMIKLTLAVSGYNNKLWSYILLDNSTPEAVKQTNRRLGSLWHSFNIQPGNMNFQDWIGRVGGAQVRHSPDLNGNDRAEIHYFIKRQDVDCLPAWQEGKNSSQNPNVQSYQQIGQQAADEFYPFSNSEDTSTNGSDGIPF